VSCAPRRAVRTKAFQIGKLDLVSFSAIGYRVGRILELALAEAIFGVLEKNFVVTCTRLDLNDREDHDMCIMYQHNLTILSM
jgi:hypothetical protein